MLQQTTVKTVVPYFEAFVARFPDISSLATASEDDVLAAWAGLGYYHRARNLRRGAQYLVKVHGGRFPRLLDAALGIPGVGLYTASAVLSIAYGEALPVVDGNVRRVLSRLFCLRGAAWKKDGPYYNLADELLMRNAPGDWNQALMELGATVCIPRQPACAACPVRAHCQAAAQGIADQLPEGRARRAPARVTVAAAIVESEGRLLMVRRREGPVLSRMWELPQTSLESGGLPDLAREVEARYGLRLAPGRLEVVARHAITFRRIRAEGYRARLAAGSPQSGENVRWVSRAEIETLPVSTLSRKLVRGLDERQRPLAL
jgi:A/G-specific adenine glycosylase